MDEQELAACPAGHPKDFGMYHGEDRDGRPIYYGRCDDVSCGWCTETYYSEAEAVAAWNRRQPAARPAWLTEYIAAGKQLIAANEFGTPDEYCIAEIALTRAALAIPQEDGK